MKTLKILAVVMLVTAVMTSVSFAAGASKNAMAGGAHDLRQWITGPAYLAGHDYRLCNFCHVAHKFGTQSSLTTAPGKLLWNHSIASTITNYNVYAGSDTSAGTYNPIVSNFTTDANLSVSTLCLSCHDGTVALNANYEYVSNTLTSNLYVQNLSVGTPPSAPGVLQELRTTHPVNFNYNQAATAHTVGAGILTAASNSSVDPGGSIPLYNGTMQCATCHDPHGHDAPGAGILARPFPTMASQTFCTYCHL